VNDVVFRLIFFLGGLALIGVAVGMVTRGAIRLVIIGVLVMVSTLAIRFAADQMSQKSATPLSQVEVPPPIRSASPPLSPSTAPALPSPAVSLREGQTGMQNLPILAQPLTTTFRSGHNGSRNTQAGSATAGNHGTGNHGGSQANPSSKRPITGGW